MLTAAFDVRFRGQSGDSLSDGVRSLPLPRSITCHFANASEQILVPLWLPIINVRPNIPAFYGMTTP
jgi:hypothetical protein